MLLETLRSSVASRTGGQNEQTGCDLRLAERVPGGRILQPFHVVVSGDGRGSRRGCGRGRSRRSHLRSLLRSCVGSLLL